MAADNRIYPALGAALRYPTSDWSARLDALRGAVVELQDDSLNDTLDAFMEHAGGELATLQEHYTRTFDLTPKCSPYVSIHIFGIEAFERTAFMSGMAGSYARVGFDTASELPDHLACLLSAASMLAPDEWTELVACILARAVPKMRELLVGSNNPYAHLLHAVELVCGLCTEVCRGE